MANKKITELDAITELTDDDLLVVVDDVAGTATTKKITKANALTGYAKTADVLTKDNTTEFVPDANYEPATKKYVDDSISFSGGGDMLKATYDPTSIEASAFDTDNHVSGITNKVYTATEQSKLSGIEDNADVTDAQNVFDAGALMTDEYAQIKRQGFVPDLTTISFDGTNTFTLGAAGDWEYYRNGLKYTVTGDKTVTLSATPPAAKGLYHIWIDTTDGTLTASLTPWSLLDTKVPVATIHWDNALTPKYWMTDERHTILIDQKMQYYIHSTEGAKALTIPALDGYTFNTDTNAAKTFEISASSLLDQDLKVDLDPITDPDGTAADYVVWYRSGIGVWNWKYSNMPFIYNVGNTNDWIQYDNAGTMTDATGGGGSLTRWANSYLLMTTTQGDTRYFFVPGRALFTSLGAAQGEDISNWSWTGLDIEEAVIAYRLTWSTVTSTSQGKCRLASITKVNIATTVNSSSGAGTDHNTLSNLQGGTTDEYYHLTSAQATVVGNTSGTNTGDQDLTTLIPKSLVDAKGDLITATADNTPAKLTAGTDGYYLKANSGTATGLEWVAITAGGQTTYDAIVATSGGTHTTLAGALAAASAGWRILVKSSTTETGNITSTLANLTIDGIGKSAIVALGTYYLQLTGTNVTINNIGISTSTGYVLVNGAQSKIYNSYFIITNDKADGSINLNSTGGIFAGNTVVGENISSGCIYFNDGLASVTSNNYFYVNVKGDTSYGTITIQGTNSAFNNNAVKGNTNNNNAVTLLLNDTGIVCNSNAFSAVDSTYTIYSKNQTTVISDNNIQGGANYGVYCSSAALSNVITGNYITATGNTGIYAGGNNIIVSDNYIYAKGGATGYGINITNSDYVLVDSNKIASAYIGIYINSTSAIYNTICNNELYGATTKITDNGLATNISNNTFTPTTIDKTQKYMKNTSGVTLNAGNLVVFKAVANGDEVTTTTTAGDDKVFGVVSDTTISNNAYGFIQTLGKVTTLTVNGTTDIAIGDPLTSFTTAGIAAKAAAGDMVIAYALEAYTTDDSNGVLDALIITPRLI